MEPRDIRLLKEMQEAIIAFQSKGRDIGHLADHLLMLRDQLQFEDDMWFHELTQHIATLDSGSTYVPTDDEQGKQADAATATTINGLQRLIKRKLVLHYSSSDG